MILEKSDANTLLVGSRETINRVPDTGLKAAMAKVPEFFAARLAFMTPNLLAQRNWAEWLQLPVLDRGRSFMRLAADVSAAVA